MGCNKCLCQSLCIEMNCLNKTQFEGLCDHNLHDPDVNISSQAVVLYSASFSVSYPRTMNSVSLLICQQKKSEELRTG